MAVNQKRRQKKLMKKILTSWELPIYECMINPSWREDGLATILLSRRQPDGGIVFGTYLVDTLCLGLKDTMCNADMSEWEYARELRTSLNPNEELVECSMPLAHHVIYGAIEFASQFGFKPQKDFKLSRYVLEDRDYIEPCVEDVEFGKDGEPMFVAGPYDDVEYVMRKLRSEAGEGNFSFVTGFDDDLFDE